MVVASSQTPSRNLVRYELIQITFSNLTTMYIPPCRTHETLYQASRLTHWVTHWHALWLGRWRLAGCQAGTRRISTLQNMGGTIPRTHSPTRMSQPERSHMYPLWCACAPEGRKCQRSRVHEIYLCQMISIEARNSPVHFPTLLTGMLLDTNKENINAHLWNKRNQVWHKRQNAANRLENDPG